jgi:hypothetical protein
MFSAFTVCFRGWGFMPRPNDGQYLLPSLFLLANARITPPMKSLSIGSTVFAFDYSLFLEFGFMQCELMRASLNENVN